ncbi:hypothetical protein [Thermocatellispora tengchongensis]|uniref:hypothetical protein n=1 Tax=Thermocatellispora tengchongensis TaxID=1073253 RepID=UPI00362EFE51
MRVYRPRGHPLPPSRWRHRLDLRPDGTYVDHRLAADDRSARDHGRWTVGPGPAIVLTPDDPAARSRRIEVVAAGPGRIEVRVPEP